MFLHRRKMRAKQLTAYQEVSCVFKRIQRTLQAHSSTRRARKITPPCGDHVASTSSRDHVITHRSSTRETANTSSSTAGLIGPVRRDLTPGAFLPVEIDETKL